MAYVLYDKDGNGVRHHDLQDKGPWCRHGASRERVFVGLYGRQLGLAINPQKTVGRNPYALDLWSPQRLTPGDLKVQNTPFFQARQRFGLDPQYAVVFNHKDRVRYQKHKDSGKIEVYFWVDWLAVRFVSGGQAIGVAPMSGVWFIPFAELDVVLERAPLHRYVQRVGDTKGNAQESYVISLQQPGFNKLI